MSPSRRGAPRQRGSKPRRMAQAADPASVSMYANLPEAAQ